MANTSHLPEYHNFQFIARVPWPTPLPQLDWVTQVTTLHDWLELRVGAHYANWAWATDKDHEYWEACVAFKFDKHKMLFLLTWS
jgi:hypothetical protein